MTHEQDAPFEVVDFEVPPSGDQVGGDVIEAAQRVRFIISKASLRKNEEGTIARLNVQAKVGPMGLDANGKYAGKVLFADPVVYVDENTFTSDWWKKQARYPWKTFQLAMGLDPSATLRINDEFLTGLQGREFIADIKKVEIREKTDEVNSSGKAIYKGTGDFKNELTNFKKAE